MSITVDSLTRDLELLRERYQKLYDSHGQLQMQNSVLEERILSIADTFSDERSQLEHELINAKQQIYNFKNTINQLEIEKQRYKEDCNLAVRLLQQNPQEFISKIPDDIQKQLKTKCESTSPSHYLVLPTFPPTFSPTFPLINTTNSSSSSDEYRISTTISAINNLHLAETLFKSDTTHSYSSADFICSKCRKTVNYCDIGVQTSFDDQNLTSQRDSISNLTSNSQQNNGDNGWSPSQSNFTHMKIQKYHIGTKSKILQDIGRSSYSIPQMHHI